MVLQKVSIHRTDVIIRAMSIQNKTVVRISLAALLAIGVLLAWYFLPKVLGPTSKENVSSDSVAEQPKRDLIDIRSVEADLQIPELTTGKAEPGKRVKETAPEYSATNAYHVTYLPVDWEPGKKYPVIVEYAGNGGYQNEFGDVSTGLVEGSRLGYGISAGKGYIWVCLPFLNHAGTGNTMMWWGDPMNFDPQSTVEYCKKTVQMICDEHGGDPDRVLLTGFSRGAIACNFIGLHDNEIAKLWRGFVPYSHYDGASNFRLPGTDRDSAIERLSRLGDRPQFICAEEGSARNSIEKTKSYLDSTGIDENFTFRSTGYRNHNDAWVLRPGAAREELRSWVKDVLK